MTNQSAAHHAHHPVPTYAATVLWLAAVVMIVGATWFGWDTSEFGLMALTLALFPVIGMSRWYIVKLQDRIIQLEMQVRCARVLPAGQDEQLVQLSPKQVVALRFASDGELSDLLARAVREQMTPDAIKKAVQHWRPDYLRT
ncbi:MAG TPA: DUF6526 family protein [Vicinamibacterales bacterium]|nr:DUF6526 family protein [Vicinamibacterales bacterium]